MGWLQGSHRILMCKHGFNTFPNSGPVVPVSYRVAAVVVGLAVKQPLINIRLSSRIEVPTSHCGQLLRASD